MRNSGKGRLIVFEGIDGSGKTTVAKHIIKNLKKLGLNVLYTYEPYDPQITSLIESKGKELGGIIETLLLAADRYLHIKKVIEPYLSKGYIIICDRYHYSSIAYQGARGVSKEWIRSVNYFVIKPDISIYLDVRPEVGIKRLRNSNRRKLKYLESIDLLTKVRDNYLDMVKEGLLVYVNAERPLNTVVRDVEELIIKVIRK